MTPEMEAAVKYQSHLSALLACLAVTSGPVLELGVGYFSTPQLHAFCGANLRPLVSVEQDPEWMAQFRKMVAPWHTFVVSRAEALTSLHGRRISVGFIDDSPGGENRARSFALLVDLCDFVVMHDAQRDAENFQAVEPMLTGLNWWLCTGTFPHTLVASKTRKIPEVLKGM